MPDDQGGDAQDDASTPDAANKDGTSKDGEGTDDTAGLKSALDKERAAKKAADGARREAEQRLKDAQARLDELEGQGKSEVERLNGERDRLKAETDRLTGEVEARDARIRDQAVVVGLTTAATRAGAKYPDLLVAQLAPKAEVDDALAVTNADALVAEAKKGYPDLFRVAAGRADGGAGDESGENPNVRPGLSRMQDAYATQSTTAKRRR